MKIIYAYRSCVYYPHTYRNAFPVYLPPKEVRGKWLSRVKSMGFDGIELSFAELLKHDDASLKDLKKELKDAGLPCLAMRGGGGMHHPRVAKQNREGLEKTVDIAARIGAEVVNTLINSVVVAGQPGDGDGEPTSQGSSRDASEADFRISAEGLAQVADKAADVGVSISIEVHHHTICDNSWSTIHMLELIDRPNVGANPDLGNIYWAYDIPEETCDEAIVALAPHANYWHCKNLNRLHFPENDRAVFLRKPLPYGDLNYRFAISAMLEAGFKGYMAVEGMTMGDQLTDDKKSLDYIRGLIAEINADK
jgi:sugar phosphate isomerase/epimerase